MSLTKYIIVLAAFLATVCLSSTSVAGAETCVEAVPVGPVRLLCSVFYCNDCVCTGQTCFQQQCNENYCHKCAYSYHECAHCGTSHCLHCACCSPSPCLRKVYRNWAKKHCYYWEGYRELRKGGARH